MGATAAEIQKISGTDLLFTDMQVFITVADSKMDRIALCDPSLTQGELNAFSNFYACYLLASGRADTDASKTEEQFEQYKVKFDPDQAQKYWNAANNITCGCLAIVEKQRATISFS